MRRLSRTGSGGTALDSGSLRPSALRAAAKATRRPRSVDLTDAPIRDLRVGGRALAILYAIQPRPLEECELRQVWGQMEMARGNLQLAEPLMDGSLPCLERALLPGEGHLMWARLTHLILLVR